ncbi:MAG TPA: bifunctional enoyl-CoA hydratase/phosphate acetyltransferase [Casimicrobiaceae bacterium]|nr:bifunctional enoyl-CoA hydratase/phosphate acetyltransferase [Casimicrobiaceae bacterium]
MVVRPHFQRLVDRARNMPPLPAAVVYPCDRDSLQNALSARFAGYLAPVLVGPEKRITDAAAQAGLDLSRIDLIDTPDDPFAAAQRAVAMAKNGETQALIKGSLYPDDLMRAVVAPEIGLRGERRLTHAFFVDVPGYGRGFVLSDAVLNIAPNLAAKRDIVQNAIDFTQALGVAHPQVAVLSAVEGVTAALPATGEAAALAKMAAQGLITGGAVDGPLTADAAMSPAAARAGNVSSQVAGNADVLIVPGMESGALLLRALVGMFGALAAGVTLGAKVPIVLSARSESMEVRMASCVLASLVAQAPRTPASATANVEPSTAARDVSIAA